MPADLVGSGRRRARGSRQQEWRRDKGSSSRDTSGGDRNERPPGGGGSQARQGTRTSIRDRLPHDVSSFAKYAPGRTNCPRASRPSHVTLCGPAERVPPVSRRTVRPARSTIASLAGPEEGMVQEKTTSPREGFGAGE